ncbi:hypothetical protein FOA52_011120 [Chlamydomonas sp. UWO 241]|nr:hypothetical protein FOA52_011120 [Chlamydomonas sp. UWO 241]
MLASSRSLSQTARPTQSSGATVPRLPLLKPNTSSKAMAPMRRSAAAAEGTTGETPAEPSAAAGAAAPFLPFKSDAASTPAAGAPAASSPNKGDVDGPMLEPSVVNTTWVGNHASVCTVGCAAAPPPCPSPAPCVWLAIVGGGAAAQRPCPVTCEDPSQHGGSHPDAAAAQRPCPLNHHHCSVMVVLCGAAVPPSFTRLRIAASEGVRTLAVIVVTAATAVSTAFLPSAAGAFVHVVAFGLWIGTIVFNTFFVGLTMFKHMPRQTFGRVQAVLFPKYFALTTGANAVLLASMVLLAAPGALDTRAATTLAVALAVSAVNWLGVEPIATKLMLERYDLENLPEKTDEIKANIQSLYKQFGKFHGISSLINLIILVCAFSHGWFLGSRLAL